MGSLKTLAFASAVAMVAASAVTSASAADLAPAPAPLMAPPPAPVVETASGIYLRGDVGVGHMGESTVSSVLTNTALVPPTDWRLDRAGLDSAAFAGVGIGYQFNSFLRADITGEYRTGSNYHGLGSYADTFGAGCFNGRCEDVYRGSLRTTLFMANGYVDLGTWRGITPFVGAGIGIANHKVQGLTDTGTFPTPGFGSARDKSSSKLAWALHAGLGFEVTRNLKMEVAYRYLNMGTAESGIINCRSAVCFNEMQKFKVQSHDVKVGLRYLIADEAPVAAAPVMYTAPAAAPVMRRY